MHFAVRFYRLFSFIYYATWAAHTKTNTKTSTSYENNEKQHTSITIKIAKIVEIKIKNSKYARQIMQIR